MKLKEIRIHNVIVGSGAAGFSAALQLYQKGENDTAIVTENINAGTSRNTGSDKQTYYKLSLAGGDPDSVLQMAKDLYAGQCVDGDIALCEAALSVRSFYRLVEMGVPFPCTEFNEYMGYKTDHDHGRRATSAGPYTSKLMTESLERAVKNMNVTILDHYQMIKILTQNEKVYGILCLDVSDLKDASYVLIWCSNLILATGGPAGMYRDSVYPESQLGSSGLAFEAGVKGKNLTEWQFGMASIHPRWNVSGTYMQVMPKFISTDQDGSDEREFLLDYFSSNAEMNSIIFLKGYQWPFDVNKIFNGSSIIDLLIYRETIIRGRRVYLDYTQNTGNHPIEWKSLSEKAQTYLSNAGAELGTPIQRLAVMNQPAIDFYLDHGVDLRKDRLEIAICAQHNNGGLSTDAHWETNIHGIFAIGEVCGSHGVTRPGGTALNAGQVGATRAAECIYLRKLHQEEVNHIDLKIETQIRDEVNQFIQLPLKSNGKEILSEVWKMASSAMTRNAGMIRDQKALNENRDFIREYLKHYIDHISCQTVTSLPMFYRLRDMLISQETYVSALLDFIQNGGGSRGSALYTDTNGDKPKAPEGKEDLPDIYQCRLDQGMHSDVIQEIQFNPTDSNCACTWRHARKIPDENYFFENQWRQYRERYCVH